MIKIFLMSFFFLSKNISAFENFNSDIIVILKNNKITFEFYNNKYTYKSPHPTYSISKAYLNLFLGYLETKGLIDINKSIFKNPSNEFESKLTLERLMRMESGYRCVNDFEGYEKINLGIIAPLRSTNSIKLNLIQKCLPIYLPGSNYHYSFFDVNLIITHLVEHFGIKQFKKLFHIFLKKELLLSNTSFNLNLNISDKLPSNYLIPPTMIWMESSPEDLLNTLQKVFLNQNTNFLNKDWTQKTIEYNPNLFPKKSDPSNFYKQFIYGRLWFLNRKFINGQKTYKDLPEEMFFIHGLKGQIVAIFPNEKAIFLRMADENIKNLADRETVLNFYYSNYIRK